MCAAQPRPQRAPFPPPPPPAPPQTPGPPPPPPQLYPPAMRPSSQQIFGYAAWGGVVGAVALYVVQPVDWIKANMGLEKTEEAAH
jgi:hypothetical protein